MLNLISIFIYQHVPIPMRTITCNRRACCTVEYCPLVPCWATTIHKFQGFEAGFTDSDTVNRLIVDPGDLSWEQLSPGTLYTAISRAKTLGKFWLDEHPKDSALYWQGCGISEIRIRDGAKKKAKKATDPKVECILIKKRRLWVEYLQERQQATANRNYTKPQRESMKQQKYTQIEVREGIVDIILNPNPTWLKLKRTRCTLNVH